MHPSPSSCRSKSQLTTPPRGAFLKIKNGSRRELLETSQGQLLHGARKESRETMSATRMNSRALRRWVSAGRFPGRWFLEGRVDRCNYRQRAPVRQPDNGKVERGRRAEPIGATMRRTDPRWEESPYSTIGELGMH